MSRAAVGGWGLMRAVADRSRVAKLVVRDGLRMGKAVLTIATICYRALDCVEVSGDRD